VDLNRIFGGVALGKDTTGNIKWSILDNGPAVRRTDGTFVALKPGTNRVDVVTGLTMDGLDFYRLPAGLSTTASLSAGDLIIVADNPFSPYFVLRVQDGTIDVLDPITNELCTLSEPTNPFGLTFFVKVVSLFGLIGGAPGATPQSLLPLLLLSGSSSNNGLLLALLLGSQSGSGAHDLKALLPLLLLSGEGGGQSDGLLALLALQGTTGATPAPLSPARHQAKPSESKHG
jgi:hypothetical protein